MAGPEKTFPIFRLAPPSDDDARIARLVTRLNLDGGETTDLPGGGIQITRGRRYLEATRDGAFWFADDDELWNLKVRTSVPDDEKAVTLAKNFLDDMGLTPKSPAGGIVEPRLAVVSGAKTALAEIIYGRLRRTEDCREMDRYVGWGVQVLASDPMSAEEILYADVLGPGAKMGVVFGDDGQIIGMNAAWREIVGIERMATRLPSELPAALDSGAGEGAGVEQYTTVDQPRLIYRAVVLDTNVPALCPFWLFRVNFRPTVSDKTIRAPDIAIPAADFKLANPSRLQVDYQPLVTGSEVYQRALYRAGISFITEGASDTSREVAAIATQLKAARWDVGFQWKDRDALESHWHADANRWVNAVDLAYYAGHASGEGWWLAKPPAGEKKFLIELSKSVSGPSTRPNGLYGQRLKWIFLAACGPLQDACLNGTGGSAFRWAGAFEGLHTMLGFATPMAGFIGDGGRTLQEARRGTPLARAWLRITREGQPSKDESLDRFDRKSKSNRWSGVLMAESNSVSPFEDRLPGFGNVSNSITSPKRFRAIWSPL